MVKGETSMYSKAGGLSRPSARSVSGMTAALLETSAPFSAPKSAGTPGLPPSQTGDSGAAAAAESAGMAAIAARAMGEKESPGTRDGARDGALSAGGAARRALGAAAGTTGTGEGESS